MAPPGAFFQKRGIILRPKVTFEWPLRFEILSGRSNDFKIFCVKKTIPQLFFIVGTKWGILESESTGICEQAGGWELVGFPFFLD